MKTTSDLQRDAWSELFKLLSPHGDSDDGAESELVHTPASAENSSNARHSSGLIPAR